MLTIFLGWRLFSVCCEEVCSSLVLVHDWTIQMMGEKNNCLEVLA